MKKDIYKLLGYIEDDLRGVHAKLTEVRAQLAALSVVERDTTIRCPRCGLLRQSERQLAEHLYLLHGGPLPVDRDLSEPPQTGEVPPPPEPIRLLPPDRWEKA